MRIALALSLLLAVMLLPLASAHLVVPEMAQHADNPQLVNGSIVETLVLGELVEARESDAYVVPGAAGQVLTVALLVPQLPGLEGFAPDTVLFWRRLPDNELVGKRIVYQEDGPARTFKDPDTGAELWIRYNFTATLPSEGTYGLVVESAENATGKYALLIGDKEAPKDFARQAEAQARMDAWLGKRASLNPGLIVAAVLIIAGLVIIALSLRKKKRFWEKKPFVWKKR